MTPKIKGHYVIPEAIVQDVINVIRGCQPAPGSNLSNGMVMDVMHNLSSVIVEQSGEGEPPKGEPPKLPQLPPDGNGAG